MLHRGIGIGKVIIVVQQVFVKDVIESQDFFRLVIQIILGHKKVIFHDCVILSMLVFFAWRSVRLGMCIAKTCLTCIGLARCSKHLVSPC